MFKRMPSDPGTQVRFLRFLVVGGTAAAVQFAALWLGSRRLSASAAFTLSFCCSTGTHYALNRFWALPSGRTDSGRQFGEYLLAVGASYLINLGAFQLGRAVFGLGVMWAAAWAIPPSTLVVFVLLNYRVFRRAG